MLLLKSCLVLCFHSLALSLYTTLYIFPLSSFHHLTTISPCLSILPSVPGLSWLLVLLYLPDAQKWYQGALSTPCPPGHLGDGLSVSPAAPGYFSSYPLIRLPDQGHQGGAVASLPETGGCAKLPQLKPRPPVCSSHQSCHWPCLPASPNLTILPMEVPDRERVLLKWNDEVADRDFWRRKTDDALPTTVSDQLQFVK